MAKPIELMPKVPDAREQLKRRVDEAPVEHADAVLSAYELLQELHESGTLNALRGVVGAGDEVVRHAVGMATKPEAVNALRNLLIVSKVLGSIDPEILSKLTADLPSAMREPDDDPPSLFAIFRRMSSKASRRALVFGVTILESVGNGLGKREGHSG